MTTTDIETYGERRPTAKAVNEKTRAHEAVGFLHGAPSRAGGGLFWFWLPIFLILIAGGALAIAALYHQPDLSIAEALAAGYGGVASLVVGIVAAAVGLVVGLVAALIGLVAAGGAVAVTLFIIASPIIAIILFVLLLRRPKNQCPDPGAH